MTTATLELLCPATTPEEALARNNTAAELWNEMYDLSVLDECSSPRRDAFYDLVVVTPITVIPTESLPEDLQSSGYVVVVKNEGRQPGKAYKVRGAKNALLGREDGVVEISVASTGNHANETAIAAASEGIMRVTVECPVDTAVPKLAAMVNNGATVHNTHSTLPQSLVAAQNLGERDGVMFIHPYDHMKVVAGQGTISFELVAQLAAMGLGMLKRSFVFPGGGGGIGAGNAVATKTTSPDTKVYISQMEGSEGIVKALAGDTMDPKEFVKSCDGAAVLSPGKIPMEIISDPFYVDDVDTVTDGQLGEAMAILAGVAEVPEPAGALALALAMKKMRANPLDAGWDQPEVMVAVTSGVMVTPDKVGEFMSAALAEGLISGTTAYNVLSQAQTEREVTGVEEIFARQEALRLKDDNGKIRDDATTRGRIHTVGAWFTSGFTAEYRLFSQDPDTDTAALLVNRARVSPHAQEWHREELADWGVELLPR